MTGITRDMAWNIVCKYVEGIGLRRHMLAVEATMRYYASIFGEDMDEWGIPGLLHDFDWEIHPTLEGHPLLGSAILIDKGVPEDIVQTILSHAPHTGVVRTTPRDRALYACDELTGLITAVTLVRPSKSINDLKVKSVCKKWKDKTFASGVDRLEIERATSDLDVELWTHVSNVIEAMRSVASELGLEGEKQF
jgi:predicted hydrolase (HD superfamily)